MHVVYTIYLSIYLSIYIYIYVHIHKKEYMYIYIIFVNNDAKQLSVNLLASGIIQVLLAENSPEPRIEPGHLKYSGTM